MLRHHDAHGAQQVRRLAILDQETAGAGAKRVEDLFVGLKRGENEHARCGKHRV
jgi:hypothetical protein